MQQVTINHHEVRELITNLRSGSNIGTAIQTFLQSGDTIPPTSAYDRHSSELQFGKKRNQSTHDATSFTNGKRYAHQKILIDTFEMG